MAATCDRPGCPIPEAFIFYHSRSQARPPICDRPGFPIPKAFIFYRSRSQARPPVSDRPGCTIPEAFIFYRSRSQAWPPTCNQPSRSIDHPPSPPVPSFSTSKLSRHLRPVQQVNPREINTAAIRGLVRSHNSQHPATAPIATNDPYRHQRHQQQQQRPSAYRPAYLTTAAVLPAQTDGG